jgi:hypothetical protein
LKGKKHSKGLKIYKSDKYTGKLKFSVLIDGVVKLTQEIGSAGSSREWERVVRTIDPKRGIAK